MTEMGQDRGELRGKTFRTRVPMGRRGVKCANEANQNPDEVCPGTRSRENFEKVFLEISAAIVTWRTRPDSSVAKKARAQKKDSQQPWTGSFSSRYALQHNM